MISTKKLKFDEKLLELVSDAVHAYAAEYDYNKSDKVRDARLPFLERETLDITRKIRKLVGEYYELKGR